MTEPRYAALILQGHSAYNNFDTFYKMVTRTFRKAGLDTIAVNMRDRHSAASDIERALQTYTQKRIISAFTLNGLGTDIGDDTTHGNMWSNLRIPVVSWMGDHPCYYVTRHKHRSSAVMPLYEYKDFLSFHRDHICSAGRIGYNPFGVWDFGKVPNRRNLMPGKPPLIIMPKTGGDPEELKKSWREILPKATLNLILNAIEDYWGGTRSGPVSYSVLRAAHTAGFELANDLTQFCFLIAQVDDYIRRRKATLVAEALLPLPVTIYGNGFDHILTNGSRAKILPPVPYETLIELYYQSAAIITLNPNVDDECHDRVYSAFGCGAMPISDINPWWEKTFPGLMPYSYDFRDRTPASAVEKVLADPEASAEKAWEYRAVARNKNTFEKSLLKTLDFAIMHRYFTFNFVPPQPYYTKAES